MKKSPWETERNKETPQQTKKDNYKKKLSSICIPSLIKKPQVNIPQQKSKKSPAPRPRRGMMGSELSFGSINFKPSPNPGIDISSERFNKDNPLNSLRNNTNNKILNFENVASRPSFPNMADLTSYGKAMMSFGEYPSFQGEIGHPGSFSNLLNIQHLESKDKPDSGMLTSIKNPVFTPGTGLGMKFSFNNNENAGDRIFGDALSKLQESPKMPILGPNFGSKLGLPVKENQVNKGDNSDGKQMFVSNFVQNQNIYINQTPNSNKGGGSIVSSSKLANIALPRNLKSKAFYGKQNLVTSSLTPREELFVGNKIAKQPVSKFISNSKTSALDKRSHLIFQNQKIPKHDLIDGSEKIIFPRRVNKFSSIRSKKSKKGRHQSIIDKSSDGVQPEMRLEAKFCLAKPNRNSINFFLSEFKKFQRSLETKEIYIQRAFYESKTQKDYIVNPDIGKFESAGFSMGSNIMSKSVVDRTNSLHPTVFDEDFYDSTLKDEEGCQDIIRNTFLFDVRDSKPVLYRKIVRSILSLRTHIFDNLKGVKSMSGAEHFMKYFNLQVPIKQQYFGGLGLKERAKLMCFFFCKFFNRNKLLGLFGQFWPEVRIHHEYKTHQKM